MLFAFAIGLALSTVQVIGDFRDQGSQLDSTIQKILKASKPPASRSVHTLDHALAQEVVAGLMQYSFVQHAVISDQ